MTGVGEAPFSEVADKVLSLLLRKVNFREHRLRCGTGGGIWRKSGLGAQRRARWSGSFGKGKAIHIRFLRGFCYGTEVRKTWVPLKACGISEKK